MALSPSGNEYAYRCPRWPVAPRLAHVKRFLRGCALLVLVAMLMTAGGYLVHGLHGAARLTAAKRRAAADLADALPASKREAAGDQARALADVDRFGRPAYSWQELHCELSTEDVGWIVDQYVQECRINSVALIPTSGADPGNCEYVQSPGGAGSPAPDDAQVYRGTTDMLEDDEPMTYCPDGIVAPSRLGVSRLLDGERPGDLGASPAWLVVVVHTNVSYSELGCDPWTILFCTAPVDRPVMGDAAQTSG